MAFLDSINRVVGKVLPPKKESIPLAGVGHGVHHADEDMIISKPAIVFHAVEIFFTFLAMACFAATAAFETQWGLAPVAITVFAMFVAVTGLILSSVMVVVPVIYDKYDKLVRVARALREVRVTFILAGAGALGLFIGSFALTISAWTQSGCSDPASDANASKGKAFQTGLSGFCQTKRAGAIFFWLAFIGWIGTFAVAFLDWRNGRSNLPRDPPFRAPVDATQTEVHDDDDDTSYVSIPRPHASGRHRDEEEEPMGGPASPFGDQHRYEPGAGRPSMDAYGAFSDPEPTGYGRTGAQVPPYSPQQSGMSRTMAYAADPYAAVKASISATPPRIPTPNMGPSYEPYQGYR